LLSVSWRKDEKDLSLRTEGTQERKHALDATKTGSSRPGGVAVADSPRFTLDAMILKREITQKGTRTCSICGRETMRLTATFATSYPVDQSQDVPGRELAAFLAKRFVDAGIKVEEVEIHPEREDVWAISVVSNRRILYVCLGGYGKELPERWMLTIENEPAPFIFLHAIRFLLFGTWEKYKTALLLERQALAPRIHKILSESHQITDIEWWVADISEGIVVEEGKPAPRPED
jgi:hypothetical protein